MGNLQYQGRERENLGETDQDGFIHNSRRAGRSVNVLRGGNDALANGAERETGRPGSKVNKELSIPAPACLMPSDGNDHFFWRRHGRLSWIRMLRGQPGLVWLTPLITLLLPVVIAVVEYRYAGIRPRIMFYKDWAFWLNLGLVAPLMYWGGLNLYRLWEHTLDFQNPTKGDWRNEVEPPQSRKIIEFLTAWPTVIFFVWVCAFSAERSIDSPVSHWLLYGTSYTWAGKFLWYVLVPYLAMDLAIFFRNWMSVFVVIKNRIGDDKTKIELLHPDGSGGLANLLLIIVSPLILVLALVGILMAGIIFNIANGYRQLGGGIPFLNLVIYVGVLFIVGVLPVVESGILSRWWNERVTALRNSAAVVEAKIHSREEYGRHLEHHILLEKTIPAFPFGKSHWLLVHLSYLYGVVYGVAQSSWGVTVLKNVAAKLWQ